MLNAFAVELHQKLFDLPCTFRRLFVQRDANHAVRGGHGLGRQTGVLALDVEVANFAEVEQLLIEICPIRHAPAVDVVGQVVDDFQARAHRMAIDTFYKHKVDVINRAAFTVAINQVQWCATNALDSRQIQFHRASRNFNRLRAQLQRPSISLLCIAHPKSHAAHRRAMFGGKVRSDTVRFIIENQIDLALTV